VISSGEPRDPPDDAIRPLAFREKSNYSFRLDQANVLFQTPEQSARVVAHIDLIFWPL
jgi:hypothetical protein